jgi:hypothetical protein
MTTELSVQQNKELVRAFDCDIKVVADRVLVLIDDVANLEDAYIKSRSGGLQYGHVIRVGGKVEEIVVGDFVAISHSAGFPMQFKDRVIKSCVERDMILVRSEK